MVGMVAVAVLQICISLTQTSVLAKPVAATSASRLAVTPDISVPTSRLPDTPLGNVVEKLAAEESPKGLVDEGGVFEFGDDAKALVGIHPHGFIGAATAAFANHYPLALRPQHFWLMILQAIAKHVEQDSEKVRSKWVAHEGKKELEARCDEFSMGVKNNWASVVDGKPDCFSKQIDRNVVPGLAEELVPSFSSTTFVENISLKITVMDITKSFFSFKVSTLCGFPSVIMEGSLDDWVLLRKSAENLIRGRSKAEFAERWCNALLPLLDKFIEEYRKGSTGKADEQFWNSMVKRGGTSGSGARTWFNGWINIFFPYILNKPNKYMAPYSPDNGYVKEGRDGGLYGHSVPAGVQGPDVADFPSGLASAPVLWDYLGQEVPLKFKAGFVGATQEQDTGVVKPLVGWFISHAGLSLESLLGIPRF